jgi:Ca2+-binding EF-hand superfamily protein
MLGKQIAKIVVGAGLLGILLTCGVRADDKDMPGPIDSLSDLQDVGKMLFKMADTNNDNRISQKEAVDAGNLLAGGFFFRADANGDGTVTAAEATAAREALFNQKPLLRFLFQRTQQQTAQAGNQPAVAQGQQTLMNILDPNRDGNLSAPEVRQAVQTSVQSLFLMADKNGDGQIDVNEVNATIAEGSRVAIQTAFNAADTDRNGAVSQAEFDKAIINPAHVLFGILDANRDNQLSADELRSGMQIIQRELQALQGPRASNTLSSQFRQQMTSPAPAAGAAVIPGQAAPAPAPATIPPQR